MLAGSIWQPGRGNIARLQPSLTARVSSQIPSDRLVAVAPVLAMPMGGRAVQGPEQSPAPVGAKPLPSPGEQLSSPSHGTRGALRTLLPSHSHSLTAPSQDHQVVWGYSVGRMMQRELCSLPGPLSHGVPDTIASPLLYPSGASLSLAWKWPHSSVGLRRALPHPLLVSVLPSPLQDVIDAPGS